MPITSVSKKIVRTTSPILKARMRVVKPLLPKKWRLRFVELHPEYDSLAGGTLLNNVYNLRSTDLGVTELLEVLVAEHQAKRQAELSFQPAMPPVRVA